MQSFQARPALFVMTILIALTGSAWAGSINPGKPKKHRKPETEEEAIKKILSQFFQPNSFAVSGLSSSADGSGKKLSGNVSFFGTPGVNLECLMGSDLKPKSILAIFPPSATLTVNHLDKLTKGELRSLLPNKLLGAGISIKNFSMQFNGEDLESFETNLQSADWDFLDFGDFKMKSVGLKIEYKPGQKVLSCTLNGQVNIGTASVQLTAAVASNAATVITGKIGANQRTTIKDVIYAMAGQEEATRFFGLIPGDVFNALALPELSMTCFPSDKKATIQARSDQGNVEMSFVKKGARKEVQLVMYAKDLGSVLPLDIFKQIQLNEPVLVVSNMPDNDMTFTGSNGQPNLVKIKEGVNIVSAYTLHPDFKKILKIDKINMVGSGKGTQFFFEGNVKLNVPFGDGGVKLTDVGIGLENTPTPGLFMNGTLSVPLGNQFLNFTASLNSKLAPPQLGGSIQLKTEGQDGVWKNPFGIPAIGIDKLGGGLMFTPIAPFLSEVQLKGGLLIGKDLRPEGNAVRGDLDMKLNIFNPLNSYLEASVNNLTVTGVINAFTDANLTGELATMLNTGIEKGKIIINPGNAQVAISGDFKIIGLNANLNFSASKTGVSASGYIDPWEIKAGNFSIFSLKGAGNNPRPGFSMSFGADPHFKLNGQATALESMTLMADIDFNSNGFAMDLQGKIFNGAFEGSLHATGKNLKSDNPSLHYDLMLSQKVIGEFKTALNGFIKQQAKNSEADIAKVRDKVNSGSKEMDVVFKGFLDGVNGLQNATATAGMMLVEGIVPDLRSISSSGDFSKAGSRMMMKIDLVVAGRPLPLAIEMDLSGDYQREMARVVEQIGMEILDSFSYLGDQVKGYCNQAGEFFVNLGEGFVQLGNQVGQTANDFVNAVDEAWNGPSIPAAYSPGPLEVVSPDVRHYWVKLNYIKVVKAADDPIHEQVAQVAVDVTKTVSGLAGDFGNAIGAKNNIKEQVSELKITPDPKIEMYGAVTFASDNSMSVPPGQNANAWSLNRTDREASIEQTAGSSLSIPNNANSTKHFYIHNGRKPFITVWSTLKEYDLGEVYTSDERFTGRIILDKLQNWNWIDGQSESMELRVFQAPGQPTESIIDIGITVSLERKISVNDFRALVQQGNVSEVQRLARKGGDLHEAGIIEPAIHNRDIAMINFLIASGATISANEVALALNPQVYHPEITNRLLARYTGGFSKDDLRNGIETGNAQLVSILLSRGAPDINHFNQAMAKNQLVMADMLLARGVPVGANELGQFVNTMNVQSAALLMKYNAKPTVAMLNQAVQASNKDMVRLLMEAQGPDQSTFQLAADKNDKQLLAMIGDKGVPISTDGPSQKAIDFNNLELLKTTFDYGASPSNALSYAIQKENLNAITFCLNSGGNANLVLPYAARKNNINLFTAALNDFNANATAALSEAITTNNVEMVKTALAKGMAAPDTRLDEVANAGNEPIVRLLVDAGGNPDLAMPGTIQHKKVALLSYLIQIGANVDNPSYVQSAVNLDALDMLTILVKAGAHPDYGMKPAMDKNSFALVSFLLTEGANPKGYLAGPSSKGDVKMMKLLLDFGAPAQEGIAVAVQGNHTPAAKLLLEFGASPGGMLPGPAQAGNTDMVKVLLEFGANPNEGIKQAVVANKTETAKLLLEAGASPNELMATASGFGNTVIATMLLDRGINANEGIRQAVDGNHTEVAVLLLDNGAAVAGLIGISAGKGNNILVSRLLQGGANPDEGTQPAVTGRHTEVVKTLIAAGANVTSSEFMVIAVKNKQEEMVRLLHANKCDVTFKNSKGNSFLHLVADDDGLVGLVKAFIEFGLNVNDTNNQGDTPLHLAAESGKDNLKVVMVLVEAGADVNAVNKKGETPRKSAKGIKVKKYLKENGGERKIKN
jgi:ankyrin repeat protein